ncbi:ABC transporter ATP-binding protein [Nonlabens sp. YIK11]|uniref:ABC transporter ATP-binding protein n=1 Tax=Nonlabens sp. YIK11 TaxID=1453349 RepID=UPI0006DC3EA6|nr:ABC transporter ATP-binding protein [Nonlabens sp. YIK11]KQC34148.1 ABC transporter ATP-binding protein [Nonlabens sp. YIK11]
MSDTILKVENISKQYRLGLVGTGSLVHDLNRTWARLRGKEDPYSKIGAVNDRNASASSDYVWALKDINFEVKRGDIIGIIGNNGAGKSTLLKIFSRVTSPTSGRIKVGGRMASLLEVGTGMHPELTGRENIYLNGAILGMRKEEIASKIDEIIDFSGCLMYIDTPVKRYSSGMGVRLGFAVAAFLEPDILVVDEVLAVGDAEFQKKAIGKMQDISRTGGRTVLFVSHNMGSILQLCSRCLILENGKISFDGKPNIAIKNYLASNTKLLKDTSVVEFINSQTDPNFKLIKFETFQQDHDIESYNSSLPFEIHFEFQILKKIEGLRIGFDLIDSSMDVLLFRSFQDDSYLKLQDYKPGIYFHKAIVPQNFLKKGMYFIKPLVAVHNNYWIIYDNAVGIKIEIERDLVLNKAYSENRPGILYKLLQWEELIVQ